MSSNFFTEKQESLIRALKNNNLKRLNILYGSVRSGKTWITLVIWALWVASMPKDRAFLMCAKTITTLKRNCLDLLTDLVGEKNFSYSTSSKTGVLFGHKIYLEGANDSRSEYKIRGMTLQGAYVDEITLIEHDFFNMLLSRLSEKNAKLFGSTNPDSPNHWLKVEYIDRANELNMYLDKFVIDENTFLDPDYVKQIKAEYTGVFYQRFIEGDFTLAEGLIYPNYEMAICKPFTAKFTDYALSIDYGTQNAFAGHLWALYSGVWYAVREYYYSGRTEGIQKTDEEYAIDLDKMLEDVIYEKQSKGEKLRTIIDPSAASFITLLRKRGKYKVLKADNDVMNGIRETSTAIQAERIKIFSTCKCMIKEFQGYVWDKNATEDKPLKVNDHAMDDMRYFVKTMHIAKPKRPE